MCERIWTHKKEPPRFLRHMRVKIQVVIFSGGAGVILALSRLARNSHNCKPKTRQLHQLVCNAEIVCQVENADQRGVNGTQFGFDDFRADQHVGDYVEFRCF